MAEEEKEERSYSFVRPGVLQSRILNRERQSALGRGLGTLLSSLGPRAPEAEQTTVPLPRLEIAAEEAQPEERRPAGAPRGALLSRLQGTHRAEGGQGFSALFRAISASGEVSEADTAAGSLPSPASVPPSAEGRSVFVGNRYLPLAPDFLVVLMDINLIQPNPFVPLSHIDREALDRLTESVRTRGFLRPLVVMPSTLGNVVGGQTFWLISGERSWQVARLLGIDQVPVRIQDVSPRAAIQMVLADDWHIQRLPPMDRARLCRVLIDQLGMVPEEISERLAIDLTEVIATLSYLDMDPAIQDSLDSGAITEAAARELLKIEDKEMQEAIWKYAVRYQWGPTRIQRALNDRLTGRRAPQEPQD